MKVNYDRVSISIFAIGSIHSSVASHVAGIGIVDTDIFGKSIGSIGSIGIGSIGNFGIGGIGVSVSKYRYRKCRIVLHKEKKMKKWV